jgi:hypothetical protein
MCDDICQGSQNEARAVELLEYDIADRLVILPCKIGDTIYKILECTYINKIKDCKYCDFTKQLLPNGETETIACEYHDENGNIVPTVIETYFRLNHLDKIGKTHFINKNDAELALTEYKSKKDKYNPNTSEYMIYIKYGISIEPYFYTGDKDNIPEFSTNAYDGLIIIGHDKAYAMLPKVFERAKKFCKDKYGNLPYLGGVSTKYQAHNCHL